MIYEEEVLWPRGAGQGVGRASTGGVRCVLLGQETLGKAPPRSWLLREVGEGPDGGRWASWLRIPGRRGLGDVGRFSRGRGCRWDVGSAPPPRIHHVDEWSHVKYPICQEPPALAGVRCCSFSSRPSSTCVVPSASFTHVSETRRLGGRECTPSSPHSQPRSPSLDEGQLLFQELG